MNTKVTYTILLLAVLLIVFISCTKELLKPKNNISFNTHLSDYHIFKGNPADLIPEAGFTEYQLATTLFTDYAEKQRLIKVPAGTQLRYNGNGLPAFPDGTILVKTFYYYNGAGNPALGKKIIETRLLILEVGKWNVATYVWNQSQTEAVLERGGSGRPVSWKNAEGKSMSINYQVPNLNECATCHNSNNEVIPIGFKLRSLNMDIIKNGTGINQLRSMMQSGLLHSFDPNTITSVVNWQDMDQSLDKRVRAYLDMNCAHCHNPAGFAASEKMNFDYAVPIEHTNIPKRKKSIIKKMESGQMPKLGTTIVDEKAVSLIRRYLETL